MGCFGPFSVAGFVAGITAVICMIVVVPFLLWGKNGLSLQKQTHQNHHMWKRVVVDLEVLG